MFIQLRTIARSQDDPPINGFIKPENDADLTHLSASYYLGQEYVEDTDNVLVQIRFKFNSPVVYSGIDTSENELHIQQKNNGVILCTLEKTISKKLLDAVKPPPVPSSSSVNKFLRDSQFILGYVRVYLPTINKKISELKYLEGHILAKTISLLDIYGVEVYLLDPDPKLVAGILWPMPISGYPPSSFSIESQVTFVRDLIDAMTSFFQYNLDDCIRKLITSLENCILFYDLKEDKNSSNLWENLKKYFSPSRRFGRILNRYVTEDSYPYIERDLKILRQNILFVYHLRNLIVHDKLRIDPSQTVVCDKAIHTLLYIYQGLFITTSQRTLIFSLYGQFKVLVSSFGGYNLEQIEYLNTKTKRRKLITNKNEMDEAIFSSLKFTHSEKKKVKSAKHIRYKPPGPFNHSNR